MGIIHRLFHHSSNFTFIVSSTVFQSRCQDSVEWNHPIFYWPALRLSVSIPATGFCWMKRPNCSIGALFFEVSIPLPGFCWMKQCGKECRRNDENCFNPVAGILLNETAGTRTFGGYVQLFQSRCRDSVRWNIEWEEEQSLRDGFNPVAGILLDETAGSAVKG